MQFQTAVLYAIVCTKDLTRFNIHCTLKKLRNILNLLQTSKQTNKKTACQIYPIFSSFIMKLFCAKKSTIQVDFEYKKRPKILEVNHITHILDSKNMVHGCKHTHTQVRSKDIKSTYIHFLRLTLSEMNPCKQPK